MREIVLGGAKAAGRKAVIDDDDFDLVSRYSWHIHEQIRPGGRTAGPYARTNIRINGKQRPILMHKLITGHAETDHKNHDGLDNRRSNLRDTTKRTNSQNRRPSITPQSSSFKGVYWRPERKRWIAKIVVDGRRRQIGSFATEEEATRAYDVAAVEIFGEFACTNFPVENPEGRREMQ